MSATQVIACLLPLKIVSVANLREHWRTKAGRAKLHRATTSALLRSHPKPQAEAIVVTLVRISPRSLDSDNLSSAFKACRDGVADWLGMADNDARVAWRYEQRKGKPQGAEVVIEWEVA